MGGLWSYSLKETTEVMFRFQEGGGKGAGLEGETSVESALRSRER